MSADIARLRAIGAGITSRPRALDRAPQGEAMNLFTPAPTPMAGQTTLEV
jgi:hypothetical protein